MNRYLKSLKAIAAQVAIQFLNEHMSRPTNADQRAVAFRDLKNSLDGGGQLTAIHGWVRAHYK